MKTLLIISSLFLLVSCQNKNDLEGIWIGRGRIHTTSDTAIYSSFSTIFDFEKDTLLITSFDLSDPSNPFNTTKYGYSLNETNRLIINDDSTIENLDILFSNQDSLVFRYTPDSNDIQTLIFKKLNSKRLVDSIELINQSFRSKNDYFDSINFVNDSLLIKMKLHQINNPFNSWSILEYKNLSFLLIHRIRNIPFLIKEANEDSINLEGYSKNIIHVVLNRTEHYSDTFTLDGSWVESNRINDSLIYPPPPPPPYPKYSINKDSRLFISFNKDSIKFSQYDFERKEYWKFNSTKQFIYFPNRRLNGRAIWKVLKLTNEQLIIEKELRIDFEPQRVKREFNRFKTAGNTK
jgi:hypothetical protein